MVDEVQIEPELLRRMAAQITDSPLALESTATTLVGDAAGATASNLGFATSQALDSFVGEVEKAVQRVIRTFANHGEGLNSNADKYARTEQDNRDSFTVGS
ncbi:MAG TPA: WXG100 family type VII secretion target [Actinocatenispora sp.]